MFFTPLNQAPSAGRANRLFRSGDYAQLWCAALSRACGSDALICQGSIKNDGLAAIGSGSRGAKMRSRRLELPQGFPHKHLKLARLPFRHDRIVMKAL